MLCSFKILFNPLFIHLKKLYLVDIDILIFHKKVEEKISNLGQGLCYRVKQLLFFMLVCFSMRNEKY